jgi:putative ABC transport system permease protein
MRDESGSGSHRGTVIGWMDRAWRDLKYGARSLRKSPGFTAVALITLALGIGAPTAIFSVIDAVMLQPLPFAQPNELVRISETKRDGSVLGPSPLDLRDFSQNNHTFQQMVVYDTWRKNVSLGAGNEPEQMAIGLMPGEYFEILKISPLMGRIFTPSENREGENYVAAISAALWRTRFAADTNILGRKILINDEPYTIVAVMPDSIPYWIESNRISGRVDVWTPFVVPGNIWAETSRGARNYGTLAQMKPGVTIEQAQADLNAIAARLGAAYPIDAGIGAIVRPLADNRVGALRPILILLTGAVSLILLIACSNLANLLLARNSARQRELAVRAALGAGRGDLLRRLLGETLLLSVAGGALGLLFARVGVSALAAAKAADMTQLQNIQIHGGVLLFTLAASLLASVMFGLAPALVAARVNLSAALNEGGRSGTTGLRGRAFRNALVVTEVALSLMLLVGAGLLIQSLLRLQNQDLGMRADHVLKGHFYLPDSRYPWMNEKDPGRVAVTRFCDEFGHKVRALPGVLEASVTTLFPPSNNWSQMIGLPGRTPSRLEDVPTARFGLADAHFLRTLGTPLIRGRDFSESDNATTAKVALISQEFARRYFPSTAPVGQRIHIGPPTGLLNVPPGEDIMDSSDVTIIGVMGDLRTEGLAGAIQPLIVVLYSQHPYVNYGFKDIMIRTAAAPHSVEPEIRKALHEMDADMPFAQVQSIDELIAQQTGSQRFTTILLTLFTAAGLLLAVVGVYGVMSFLVTQRTHEMAVRVALGATRANVLGLVIRQGLKLAAIGSIVGLAGALAIRQVMSQMLFGISAADPATLASGAFTLIAVAAIACAIPGMRAMRVDPARALRQQ